MILTSTKEGDLVLDPVAGTGTTVYVAKALKRDFVMIEINEKYVKGIVERFKMPLDISNKKAHQQKKINKYLEWRDKNE